MHLYNKKEKIMYLKLFVLSLIIFSALQTQSHASAQGLVALFRSYAVSFVDVLSAMHCYINVKHIPSKKEIALKNLIEKIRTYGVNTITGPEQETLLHYAARTINDEEIVAILISEGAHINAQNKDESTPLHVAVQRKEPKIVIFLLQNGAKMDMPAKDGETPFTMARCRNKAQRILYDTEEIYTILKMHRKKKIDELLRRNKEML